jgi:hypothetical protein
MGLEKKAVDFEIKTICLERKALCLEGRVGNPETNTVSF